MDTPTAHNLEAVIRNEDKFIAILSHELRNSLSPIKTALYLLQTTEDNTAENQKQLFKMMERQVDHLSRLVNDLIEMSRINTGKIELYKEPINLADIINTAIEASKPLLDNGQHHLKVSLPPKPLILNADRVRLTQVFTNLLNNAAKYTPAKGSIDISILYKNNMAIIAIRDNGIGISSSLMPKIFEMFTQGEYLLNNNYPHAGMGIGLAMVRKLVDLHGGTVSAHSAGLNQGSEFIVRLPVDEKNND